MIVDKTVIIHQKKKVKPIFSDKIMLKIEYYMFVMLKIEYYMFGLAVALLIVKLFWRD